MEWGLRINKQSESIDQELRKVGVHNYYDLIMASWNNIHWVYDLDNINSFEREILQVISAYSLYLTSIGDVDKALDPMQWNYMTLWSWKLSCSNHQRIYGY